MTRSERLRGAALATALLASGCAIDDRTLTVKSTVIPLVPDVSGYVNGYNEAGIRGGWDAFVDTQDCTSSGVAAERCSTIQTTVPIPSDLATGKMCISGTSAQALSSTGIWGAGIEIDFNTPNVEDPYDAHAHGVTGFSFEIDSPPAGAMLINFPVVGRSRGDVPSWGGATDSVSPVTPGLDVVRWADVGGPSGRPDLTFDEAQLLRIQFYVPANADHATPFSFCVSNLSARMDGGPPR